MLYRHLNIFNFKHIKAYLVEILIFVVVFNVSGNSNADDRLLC